nr:CPBP family glutamic-type intramembrane protease [uncultured Cellulosilyticum sp.]
MDPITVAVQTINAAVAGVLFAVIYILCKNLWAVIIVHGLVDWLSSFIGQCFVGGNSVLSMNMSIGQGGIMVLLGSLPPIMIALLFMKFFKYEAIE